jgi:hypothetical protein
MIEDEFFEGECKRVPVCEMGELDTIEDVLRERVKYGQEIAPLIHAWAVKIANRERAKTILDALQKLGDGEADLPLLRFINCFMGARDAALRADQMRFAMGLLPSETLATLGEKHGVDLQTFDHGAKKCAEVLGVNRLRSSKPRKGKQ